MVRVVGGQEAGVRLKQGFVRFLIRVGVVTAVVLVVYFGFTARVGPNEFGIEQRRFGMKTGIVEKAYGPGLYVVPPGTTMHTFPREVHILEASYDRQDALSRAKSGEVQRAVERYFDRRDQLLGKASHRVVDALNIQTSDGYAVAADVTLLYAIDDPVKIAKEFGWGSLYVDSFVINTFRNGVLATLGKMNAESFYHEEIRIHAVEEAEAYIRQKFADRGFRVEKLLLRGYRYADNYERSLHDKKVAVQLTEKNRKEGLVNEEKAKLQQIESKGNATITIAESEVNAQISKIKAEAALYSSQVHAKADTEVNIAQAEAKRLKAEALNAQGGRYVVALETAKMLDSIDGAVMTPEQYINFIRATWAVIGVGGSSAVGEKP